MELGLRGKPFYCRDWAFEKLRACLDKRPGSTTCGTLVMGDSGCGKTAFCSQLVWPNLAKRSQVSLHRRLLAHHFCSVTDSESLSLSHFLVSLTNQLTNHSVIGESFEQLLPKIQPISASSIQDADEYMVTHIIAPLSSLHYKSSDPVLYLLVDSLDESDDATSYSDGRSHTIAQLLSRYHKQLPQWLALVCSCSSKAKRVSRLFTGFRKLSLDDITKSHVIHDIQQYILHRLDSDDSLRKHLNKDTAEILDKLHVKCNGCLLYIELILDLVSQGSVSLRQVRDIPGTLVGLYMWTCQRLFPDVTLYLHIARPVFNVILAARSPLPAEEIYQCLLTRNKHIRREDFTLCMNRLRQILSTQLHSDSNQSGDCRTQPVTFCHPSFRLWLQDVKFCSRSYLCDPREGHEMLTLYYTIRARHLTAEEVCQFAYHIQRCNTRIISSHIQSSLTNSTNERDLTIHEQAVWMLLSRVELSSPNDSLLSNSMVDSFVSDSMSLPDSHHTPDLNASGVTEASVSSSIQKSEFIRSTSPTLSPHSDREQQNNDITSSDDQSSHAHKPNNEQPKSLEPKNQCDIEVTYSETDHSLADHDKNSELPLADCDHVIGDTGQLLTDDVDELECLDEDLEGGRGVGGLIESEIESISSPQKNDQTVPGGEGRQVDLSPGSETLEQTDLSPASETLEEALLSGDISWLEKELAAGLDVNISDHNGHIPLIMAAKAGQLEAVEMLILMAGAEVNFPDADQKTALGVASYYGHENIVNFLLNNDADVNKQNKEGHTPLFSACYMGHSGIVGELLSHGADVNERYNDDRTALCVACSCGTGDENSTNHVQVVKLLIQSGSDVNGGDKSLQTPLHLASYEGNLDICNVLVEYNAQIDSVDEAQRTPLMCAVSMGHSKVVDLLIASGADVQHLDQDGRTSLGIASLTGHADIVKTFLEMGQDEMHRDNYGVDCLHFSSLEGHAEVSRLLLMYGADVNSQDDQGRSSLFMAAQQGRIDCIKVLLKYKANVNLPAHNGRSPLRVACTCSHVSCADLLISHGADIHCTDMDNRGLIYILALENKPECITLLINAGADIDSGDEEGRSALHVACWQGHVEVVSCLLELGAELDCMDNERRTPLQSAAWQGHDHIAQMLCERGANVNHMCDQGATPLCISAQEGYLDMVTVLCKYGADPNHSDKFGRTALKIAMKASNDKLLHLIENIMRRYKPSIRTPDAARSSRSSHGEERLDTAVYENCGQQGNQSPRSTTTELVEPYAVVSLRRDLQDPRLASPGGIRLQSSSYQNSPTHRALDFSSHNLASNRRRSVDQLTDAQRHSASNSPSAKQRHSVSNISKSTSRSQQSLEGGVQKLRLTAQHFTGSYPEAEEEMERAQHQSAEKHHQYQLAARSKEQVLSAAQARQRLSAVVVDSSESSDGCDTAPSTISSRGDNKSSPRSTGSTSPPAERQEGSFTQQIVQLRHGSIPRLDNVDQILSGEVGYMANPRVNRALYNASLIAAGQVSPSSEKRPSIRPQSKNPPAYMAGNGKSSRSQSKQTPSGGKAGSSKMSAVQNTARTPVYKVQYAAAEHPKQIPTDYSVRHDQLLSAEHSLSSVKSRQARIVSSSGTRSISDDTSLKSPSEERNQVSPPPMLPPRRGRSGHTPLHTGSPQATSNKPTLVGVVRPRAQVSHSSNHHKTGGVKEPLNRPGQKETSL